MATRTAILVTSSRLVQEHQPAAVILLGDLQAKRPLEVELAPILDKTEVWFIHGNHDTDDELARRLGVTTSFHGHHHDQLDYSAERTRLGFDAFGVGFCGILDQDGQCPTAKFPPDSGR